MTCLARIWTTLSASKDRRRHLYIKNNFKYGHIRPFITEKPKRGSGFLTCFSKRLLFASIKLSAYIEMRKPYINNLKGSEVLIWTKFSSGLPQYDKFQYDQSSSKRQVENQYLWFWFLLWANPWIGKVERAATLWFSLHLTRFACLSKP